MFDVTLKLTYTDTDAKGVETVTNRDLDLRRMFIRETDEMKSLTGWVPIEWLSWLDQRDGRAPGTHGIWPASAAAMTSRGLRFSTAQPVWS